MAQAAANTKKNPTTAPDKPKAVRPFFGSPAPSAEPFFVQPKLEAGAAGDSRNAFFKPAEKVLQSPGEPLAPATQDFMESRFGEDLGDVRVHDDSQAHASSAEIEARAYTHQNHIVFGQGEYDPASSEGKTLIAHELTHVLQQAGGDAAPGVLQRDNGDGKNDKFEFLEPQGDIDMDILVFKRYADFQRIMVMWGGKIEVYNTEKLENQLLDSEPLKKGVVLRPGYYRVLGSAFYPLGHNQAGEWLFAGKKDLSKASPKEIEMYKQLDKAYTSSNWFPTKQKEQAFEKYLEGDLEIGFIVMPFGSAPEPVEKKEKEKKDEKETVTHTKEQWMIEFEKKFRALIISESTLFSTDIPADFKFYFSETKQDWRAYADQKDEKNKPVNKVYLEVHEKDKPEAVMETVRRLIRIERLKKLLEVTPHAGPHPLPPAFMWAYELKLQVQKLMADERKTHTHLIFLPDALGLVIPDEDKEHVFLQIIAYVKVTNDKNEEENQLKTVLLPKPLAEGMKPEDVLNDVKMVMRSLRQVHIKKEGQDQKDFQYVKDRYPSDIVAENLRPDGETVLGGELQFKMEVDMESMESTILLDQATKRMQTVFYYWDVYRIDQQVDAQYMAGLPADWPSRRKIFQEHFKHSDQLKTPPVINQDALKKRNDLLKMLGLPPLDLRGEVPRKDIEELKSYDIFYGSRNSFDPETKITLPEEGEGEYLIFCSALVKPTDDTYVLPSEAFLPIKVINGYRLAEQTVNKPWDEIEDKKREIAAAETPKEKAKLQKELQQMTRYMGFNLETRLLVDLGKARDVLEAAKHFNMLYFISTHSGKPLPELLAQPSKDREKMLQIWYNLTVSEPGRPMDDKLTEYIGALTSQVDNLSSIEENLDAFSDDYDHSKPTFTPSTALVSQVTGQEYSLITMIAETAESNDKVTHVVLFDVTTDKNRKPYYGSSTNPDKRAAYREAVQAAYDDMGANCDYGKGYIYYRIPGTDLSGQSRCKPGVLKTVLNVLSAVAMVAGIVALLATPGGALALIAGIAAIAIGAGLAANDLRERYKSHHRDIDMDVVIDVLNIMGPLLAGTGKILGGLTKFARGLEEASVAVNALVKLSKGIAIIQKSELALNLIAMNTKVVLDLRAVSKSKLSPEQKDAMTMDILINAALSNLMVAVAVKRGKLAEEGPKPEDLDALIDSHGGEAKFEAKLRADGLKDEKGNWRDPGVEKAAQEAAMEDAAEREGHGVKPGAEHPAGSPVEPEDKGPHVADDYEKDREVKMKGHEESPDHQHEVEVYEDGEVGRCSPMEPGKPCPNLRVEFGELLKDRPQLKGELEELLTEIKGYGENVPKAKMQELADFELRLRRRDLYRKQSVAPKDYKVRELPIDPKEYKYWSVPTASEKIIYESTEGHRIWMDENGGTHHEGPILPGTDRGGEETSHFSGGKSGIPGLEGDERAHSWGPGWGWGSPFAIKKAPSFVNQTLQNHGIEQYARSLRDALPPGQTLFMHTVTKGEVGTTRLATISYEGSIVTSKGAVVDAFTYDITIKGDVGARTADAAPIKFLNPQDAEGKRAIDMIKKLIPTDKMPKPLLENYTNHAID